MPYHHKSEMRLGINAEVNHLYYHEANESITIGFMAVTGSFRDESTYTFIRNEIDMSMAQAKEVLQALTRTFQLLESSPCDSEYLEREQLGLEAVRA